MSEDAHLFLRISGHRCILSDLDQPQHRTVGPVKREEGLYVRDARDSASFF